MNHKLILILLSVLVIGSLNPVYATWSFLSEGDVYYDVTGCGRIIDVTILDIREFSSFLNQHDILFRSPTDLLNYIVCHPGYDDYGFYQIITIGYLNPSVTVTMSPEPILWITTSTVTRTVANTTTTIDHTVTTTETYRAITTETVVNVFTETKTHVKYVGSTITVVTQIYDSSNDGDESFNFLFYALFVIGLTIFAVIMFRYTDHVSNDRKNEFEMRQLAKNNNALRQQINELEKKK